jgi:hypothetical protein
VLVLFVLVASVVVFSALTTVVSDGTLKVLLGLGLIRRRIHLSEVREVREVTMPWYSGRGIRMIRRGWLWSVSGSRAVEIEFLNGRRFRVGTDEPEALAGALRQHLKAHLNSRSTGPG